MKRTSLLLAFFVVLTHLAFASSAWAEPVTGALRAGRDARALCTLDGVPLAGYGGGTRRKSFPSQDGHSFFLKANTGVHDTVRVKTVVIEVEGKRLALISLDAIGAARSIVDRVVSSLDGSGLTRESILIVGTHTHNSVGAISDKLFWQVGAVDKLSPSLLNHVVDNIVDSVQAALDDMQPAKLGNGISEVQGINRNRRTENAPVSKELGLLKIETMNGDPLAVLFNFAVHGTSLSASDLDLSADNMGYAERYLEEQLPGSIALFFNGAEGDVAPSMGGHDGARIVGETLGAAVKNLWDNTLAEAETTLEIQSIDTNLPEFVINVTACGDEFTALFNQWDLVLPGEAAETSEIFMAVRINNDAFLAVPGEAITEVGRMIQEPIVARGFENAFIMGLANGYMGYVVTPEEYDLGGYEACGTLYGRDTSDTVIGNLVAAGELLTPPTPSSTEDADAGAVDGSDAGPVDVGGDAGIGGNDEATADESTGCGCRTQGKHGGSGALLLLAGLFAVLRRRRSSWAASS